MNRTIYFDNIINKSKDKVEKFVVMGAGFDTRCYGDLKNSNLKFFELDQAKTQKLNVIFGKLNQWKNINRKNGGGLLKKLERRCHK